MTYMDGLYEELSRRNRFGDNESISKIQNFLENEEYDSDALKEDVYGLNQVGQESNISKAVKDQTQFKVIQDYIRDFKCMYVIHLIFDLYN